MKKLWIGLILSIFVYANAFAAPSQPSISGNYVRNGIVTITGSGFGTNGPTIDVYDDFEGGSNGAGLSTSLAPVGSWGGTRTGQCTSTYTSSQKLSGNLSMYVPGNSGSCYDTGLYAGLPSVSKVFFQYHTRISTLNHGNSWKTVWLWYDHLTSDISIPTENRDPNSWLIDGNDNTEGSPYGVFYPGNSHISANSWIRRAGYVELTTSHSGKLRVWETYSGGNVLWASTDTFQIATTSAKWIEFNVPGIAPTASLYYDDFYLAYGDNAQARIEIGNSTSYSSCTKMGMLVPTSWSPSSITAKFFPSNFSNGETGYIYVTDANGSTSPASAAITVGSGGGDSPPTCTITSPTSSSTYDNGSTSTISLGGTASDDNSISSVTWACPTCSPSSGTATGTYTWSISNVGLSVGSNVFTVTAHDNASQTGNDTLTVTYTAPDTTPPTVSSASINDDVVTIGFDESVVTTGYDTGDLKLNCSTAGSNINLSSPSGSGSSRTFTSATPVANEDTCTLAYSGSTDDIEDTSGNDMETFSGFSVTVNTPPAYTELIIDNTDAGFSYVGNWLTSTYWPGYYGSNYLYSSGADSETATWETSNLSPGTFYVYARWTTGSGNRPTAADYAITHSGGTTHVQKDQNSNGGEFQLLGSYTFGSTGSVTLTGCSGCSDGTSADAIYFTQAAPADITPATVLITDTSPKLIYARSTVLTGTSSDDSGIHECKWRLGSSPNEDTGSVCTGTTSWSCTVANLSKGTNTVYVDCSDDSANRNWGGAQSIEIEVRTAVLNAQGSISITHN